VANPGCYPTASILGALPFLKNKKVDTSSLIVDAKSGTTGAGRKAALALLHSEVAENIRAYKVNRHQHMPEIEQVLSAAAGKKVAVNFVPHLIPIKRGILTTLYFRTKAALNAGVLVKACRKFYSAAPFVRVLPAGVLPEIKNVAGTNFCELGLSVDNRKNTLIVITAIDNLGKGAAGQAVQNMNLMCGIEQTTGLL
jgi:N-acetyl-gamma-glutamyl-phosphate reductase